MGGEQINCYHISCSTMGLSKTRFNLVLSLGVKVVLVPFRYFLQFSLFFLLDSDLHRSLSLPRGDPEKREKERERERERAESCDWYPR
jgi:hypothetical protein